MCAICGSDGFAAPWAKMGADSRQSAAIPADNLKNMGTSVSHGPLAVPCIDERLDARALARFPENQIAQRRRTMISVIRSQRRPPNGKLLVSAGPNCLSIS